jgi:pimeloyl-ACP methyl ester carboxylesterase
LVVWGRHDRLIDVSCVAPIKAGIPNCQAVILEDIGHLPMIEAPETLAAHHLPFLAKA